jgi:hypothetical protein
MSYEKVFSYSVEEYPFYDVMKEVLDTECNLTKAHAIIQDSVNWEQITFENDTSTLFHKRYYNSPKYIKMVELYQRFLREYLLPQLEEEVYIIQKEPSFRIHIPNNTALGKREDDNDDDDIIGIHCDGDYNHPTNEMNYMITVTGQSDTNSCYVETEPGKGDFHPINIIYGEVFRFYGNQCRHFNKKNKSEDTRISLDFRVIPGSKYEAAEQSAVHSGRKFIVGDYYMRLEKK